MALGLCPGPKLSLHYIRTNIRSRGEMLDNAGKQGNDATIGNDGKQGNEGKGLSWDVPCPLSDI